jgi:Variant SH3 domain
MYGLSGPRNAAKSKVPKSLSAKEETFECARSPASTTSSTPRHVLELQLPGSSLSDVFDSLTFGTEFGKSLSDTTTDVVTPITHVPIKLAKVKKDHVAKNADELTLEEDDLVCILSAEPRQLYLFGTINGAKGWFPASCVTILSSEEALKEKFHDLHDTDLGNRGTTDSRKSSMPTSSVAEDDPEQGERGWFNRYKSINRHEKKNQEESTALSKTHSFKATTETPNLEAPIIARTNRNPGHRPLWIERIGGQDQVEKMGISRNEVKRQEIILEIITTEADYIEDLEIVCEVLLI